MFSLLSNGSTTTRREILRIGGLSLLGLSTGQLESLRAAAPEAAAKHHRSCVFLFLFGGPSQIDLWDMKPDAPAEVRGAFQPRATNVPGIHVCEHLPNLARHMDKICLLRSMTHKMNVHGPACSEIFSGREYFGAPTTDQASEQDWPSLSAMTMRYGASNGALPPSIVLPWYLQFPGQAKRIAGQTGGRMGERFNGLLIKGDSDSHAFQVDGFDLRETVQPDRLNQRRRLLSQLQADSVPGNSVPGNRARQRIATTSADQYDRHRERAFRLLQGDAGKLLDVTRESSAVRDTYGRTMVGQSLLMARRLVEAGVSLITVNWEDETKIDGVNTCWDTHQNNFSKLQDLLCPTFDHAFPAFINDLDERGLLESTLVVAVGEFGRTPHMGQFSQSSNTRKTGRDHWPSAFTALLAGGGVRGGQVYGATDHHAAQVKDKPVSPADLSATILDHLGINPARRYVGEMQQTRYRLSVGKPLKDLG